MNSSIRARRTKRPAHWKPVSPGPELSDFTNDDETLIELLEPVDGETGKATFLAYWVATDALREGKVAGQIYHTHVQDFIDRHAPYPVRKIGEHSEGTSHQAV